MLLRIYDIHENDEHVRGRGRVRLIEVPAPLPDQIYHSPHGRIVFELSRDRDGRPCYMPQPHHRYARPQWLDRVLGQHRPPTPPPAPRPARALVIDPRVYRHGPNLLRDGETYWMPARMSDAEATAWRAVGGRRPRPRDPSRPTD